MSTAGCSLARALGVKALAVLAVLVWMDARLPMFHAFAFQLQADPAHCVASDLPNYLAMADCLLRTGVLGRYDASRVTPVQALARGAGGPEDLARPRSAVWKPLRYNDWGYELVIAAAWLATCHRGVLPIVVFQHGVDLVCMFLVFWIACRLASPWAGAAAALVWAMDPALVSLVNQPYYYYWNVVAGVFALAIWCRLYADGRSSPTRGTLVWMLVMGLTLGLGTLIRATNEALLVLFLLLLAVRERLTRRGLLLAALMVVGFLLPLLPVIAVKYRETGRIQLTGKGVFWHTMLCGVGIWDNPWGLKWDDMVAMSRIKAKYGVAYDLDNMAPYEAACKREVLALWRENPRIFVRNFFWNLGWGLKYRSMMPPDQDMPSTDHLLRGIRRLMWLGVASLLALGWRSRPHLRYWLLVLGSIFFYSVLVTAVFVAPNFEYSSGLLGPEVLLAGIGVGSAGAFVVERLLRLGRHRAP